MFQLTREEFENLKFHFGTSSWGGVWKLPKAFTEQGDELEKKYDAQFRIVFDAIRRLMKEEEKPRTPMGFHA